jgi:hypothetical protein
MPYDPDSCYSTGGGRYQTEYNELFERLVPTSGPCETLEGELLRASSRIYHDYYNNGFGNNWSGAFNFLDTHVGLPRHIRARLSGYRLGRCAPEKFRLDDGRVVAPYSADDPITTVLEELSDLVIERVMRAHHTGSYAPSPCDLFALQEKSYR